MKDRTKESHDSSENVRLLRTRVQDPLYREVETEYLIDESNKTAYIEVANTSGL